ncbi:ATP-binding cassette domain-containing protein [Bacillaceae bacterium Marseille-Q3522]|nr:ATP-binding cassette domain-containing protein [Bacillaceae bacterium Marseille-Q3522]
MVRIENIIEVNHLKKHFTLKKGRVLQAIDNVSFSVAKGETLGIVGESGCGKSTLGRTITRIYRPTSGEITFAGKNIAGKLTAAEEKAFQKKVQMIFQDPYSSLNPRMTVREIIAEGIIIHGTQLNRKELEERVYKLLEIVGLNKKHSNRYPHEFSGGQRQRIGIARALAVDPEVIIADEPIAALDVSIQAQIVNLLIELQQNKGLSYLFIAHDLSMVRYISDRVAVMYLGNFVEMAASDDLYKEPLHPYTQALLSAIPVADPIIEQSRERFILKGTNPSPVNPPSGCRFRTRCPMAMDICAEASPKWREVTSNHYVSCHLFE